MIRAAEGKRDTVVTHYDLTNADVVGSAVLPTWSDPRLVIETYGLGQLVELSERLLTEVFGAQARVTPGIVSDPDTSAPSLVLHLSVPRPERHLRHDFLVKYAQEVLIPDRAPAPVLLWHYQDAVPA